MAKLEGAWARSLLGAAGLLGVAGVALGAASAHLGGGDLVRLASAFALFHAAAVPGVLAGDTGRPRLARLSATGLALGAALFSADVAVLGFTGRLLLSGMAPLGGILMMAGWLLLLACAVPPRRGTAPDA